MQYNKVKNLAIAKERLNGNGPQKREEIEFFQSIQLILDLSKDVLKKQLILTEKKINQFLKNFIQSLPVFIKSRLEFSMCES